MWHQFLRVLGALGSNGVIRDPTLGVASNMLGF
jgi:hypothetical protein